MNYEKVLFLAMGIVSAWLALYVMLAYFYEGMLQATIASIQGGQYLPYYLRGDRFVIWILLMLVSAVSFGVGLSVEKKEERDP